MNGRISLDTYGISLYVAVTVTSRAKRDMNEATNAHCRIEVVNAHNEIKYLSRTAH